MFAPTPLRRTYSAAIRDLGSAKAAVRASAAEDLGLVGSEDPRKAADALRPLLDDGDAAVRGQSLAALGALDARHLLDAIAARLDDPDSHVRQVATMTLAELGGDRALVALRGALEHKEPDVRFQALVGIAKVDATAGFDAALDALGLEDLWIASEGAELLGLLGSELGDSTRVERAIAGLRARLSGSPARVQVSAALALLRLGRDDAALSVAMEFVKGTLVPEGDDRECYLDEAIALLGGVTTGRRDEAREALARHARGLFRSDRRERARAALKQLGATDGGVGT